MTDTARRATTMAKLLFPATGAIYNQMHPDGWRWEHLTSGEAAEEAAKIEPVLAAVYELGFDFVRPESRRTTGTSGGFHRIEGRR